jgi:hypothetical protein
MHENLTDVTGRRRGGGPRSDAPRLREARSSKRGVSGQARGGLSGTGDGQPKAGKLTFGACDCGGGTAGIDGAVCAMATAWLHVAHILHLCSGSKPPSSEELPFTFTPSALS